MSKKGVSKLIREALKAGPMTTAELRVALGLSRGEVNTSLNDMMRAKSPLVVHDGASPGNRRYSLVREPVFMSEAERLERRREQQRAYNASRGPRRKPGVRTREQYLADMAAQREANADARRLKHNAWKRAKAAKTPKPPKPTPSIAIARKLEKVSIAKVFVKPEPEPVRLMSSEEWLAQGGQIERLPAPWEVRP